jgi:hypothetical protein
MCESRKPPDMNIPHLKRDIKYVAQEHRLVDPTESHLRYRVLLVLVGASAKREAHHRGRHFSRGEEVLEKRRRFRRCESWKLK